jgi:hypothetical protein
MPKHSQPNSPSIWPDSDRTQELLAAARDGDREAVEGLMDRHRGALRKLVENRMDRAIGRRVDASDVVQDVLLEASNRLTRYLEQPTLPFHLWLTPKEKRGQGAQLALHLLPALAAFHLLSRFPLPLLGSISWVALGIAGLLGSAIAAWTARDGDDAWIYILINRVTWAMLSFSLSRDVGGYRAALPLTATALSLTIWTLGPS